MEGQPKLSAEKPRSNEAIEESVERALELLTEIQKFHDVKVVGKEAMVLNDRAEELAKELKDVLKTIPMKACIENNLPFHPSDIKPEVPSSALPAQPDYPLSYPATSAA